MKACALAAVLLLALPSLLLAQPQGKAEMSYDEFFQLPAESRGSGFNENTPATKSRLLREQAARWREKHRDRVTDVQWGLIDEFIAFHQKWKWFDGLYTDEETEEYGSISRRQAANFAGDDFMNAFTPLGDYIPQ